MTERNRNQLQQTATASGAALLPALPSVPLGSVNPDLRRFLEAVKERLEVREGSRGNPFEAVVTKRDLASAGLLPSVMGGRSLGGVSATGGLMMRRADGSYATLSVDEFAAQIYQSPLFQSLKRSLSDPARFDDMPSEVKNYLLNSIAEEAARRGADIRNTEFKLQAELRSLAYKVEEVTASVAQAAAGVRETTYAVAEVGRATAGKITQVEARLDFDVPDTDKLPLPPATPYATLAALQTAVPVGDPTKYYRVTNQDQDADPATDDAELLYVWNGTQYLNAGVGVAKLEQRMTAVSDRVTGTESQYTLKVNAGGAVAGIGLAATSNLAGGTTSALIVQADKIAFVSATDVIGTDAGQIDPSNPPTNRVPFGVDTVNNVVYINGQLRVGSPTGPTMDSITTAAGIYLSYSSQFFKYDTAGNPLNTSVVLTANVTGSLTGTLEWTALSGYSGAMPADVTVTADGAVSTATINVANMTADTAAFSITLTDGAAVYTDFVTLVKLRDGADAYTARLTNDSAGVATTSAGVPLTGGFANATTVLEVYRGATKLTSGVTYSVLSNPQGLSGSINSSGAFSVTAKGLWPDATNTASITLRAVVTGGPTLTKDFTLTKNLQGVGYSGVTSTSSLTIGTGSKQFATTYTGAFAVGARVRATNSASNWMEGVITALVANTSITVNVDQVGGSGTLASWTIVAAGNLGNTGNPGTRGTITTKLAAGTTWSAANAAAAISAVATAAGATPTTPIKGDIVYYTGGAYECTAAGSPGTWSAVAAFIDGSLVVAGTLTASSLKLTGAGAVTASTVGGVATDLSNAPASILNSNITLSSNGTLSGAGGGSVSLTGLGFSGDTDATKSTATLSATQPSNPRSGDIWIDSSVTPNVVKVYTGSVWTESATKNKITSGALASRPTGDNGDVYYATDTKALYQKVSGAWVLAGTNNSSSSGTLVSRPTSNAVGDTYFATDTNLLYVCTAAPNTWSTGASLGAPAGTLINGVSAETVTTAVTNFNASNDRIATAIAAPTIATNGTAVDHTLQTDGSADVSFEWAWSGAEGDIDGFQVFVYQTASSTAYIMGTTPASETVYEVPASKRAFILFGVAANRYYTFGVRAYRAVDKDIAASGYILSSMAQPTLAAETPYLPSSTVAFGGDVTGTVNGIAATNVNVWASISGTGKPADNATKNVVTYSGTAPSNPVDGDIWVDTSASPSVAKVRVAGAWQTAANNTTNTNQLVDGANLGQTALWSSVTNRPANLAALTGSEAIQNSLITAASINALSSNSRNALTGSAGLAIGSIAWNTSGVRTSGYGIGITENGIAAFNSAGSQTFALDGTTGNASFAGTLSAASGTLGTITAGTITGTSLSVGSSPSVSGTTMTGSGAVLNNGGTFALGSSTGNITYNGTTITLNGATVVNGTLNGTAVSTVVAGAAAGATAVQPSDITKKLEASTSYTLTGVITPADSGALKVGGITWDTTTGALTGGSGIAITEAGIIGAKNGAATFSIDTSGNATFKGDITGASGTFSGSLNAATITGGTISGSAFSVSTTGYVLGGQTDYATGTGFFLGYSSSAYKFSLGKYTVSAATSNTTTFTTTSAHGLAVGTAIYFVDVGSTGLTANTAYYVRTVPSSTTFTIASYVGATSNLTFTHNIGSPGVKIALSALTWDGSQFVVSGATITGTAISGSTISGATFQTAASGARTTINESSNNKIIGYDDSNVQRTIIEANVGYISVTKNASAAAIYATNTFATTDVGGAIFGTSTNGTGVDGRSTNRVGVEGRSTNYIGGAFYGGSNAPPIYINPNGSLPTSGALQGSLCVVSGKLYFHNGTTWKEVQLV